MLFMKPSEIKVATQHAAKRARLAEQRAAVAERKAAAAKATARQSRSIFKQARKASRKARKAAKRARAKAVQAQIALAEWKERIARSSKRLAMRKKPSEERHSRNEPSGPATKGKRVVNVRGTNLTVKPRRHAPAPSAPGSRSAVKRIRVEPAERMAKTTPPANETRSGGEPVVGRPSEVDESTKPTGLADFGGEGIISRRS